MLNFEAGQVCMSRDRGPMKIIVTGVVAMICVDDEGNNIAYGLDGIIKVGRPTVVDYTLLEIIDKKKFPEYYL